MKTMWQKQIYSIIRNIFALTFIISRSSGLIYAFFSCSNYIFHEPSIAGRSWEKSRLLCQNSFEGDLVSIEEEEERNFAKNIIKNLTAIKYFIGLKKVNGKWKWLSNQTVVNSSQAKSPWAPGQPSGTPDLKDNCATIYGIYLRYLGLFDDMSCTSSAEDAGHICERAVSCTKDETDAQATKERQRATSVHSTSRTPWKTQLFLSTAGIDSIAPDRDATKEAQKATPVHSITTAAWKSQCLPSTAEIDSIAPDQHATKEKQKATSVHSTTRTPWKTQPFPTTAEIDSIAPETTHLGKANKSSYLIAIIASVLVAFVILGIGVALLLLFRPRKKGSKLKIQRCMRQGRSIKLKDLDSMSPAEQEMDAYDSLSDVNRQDACVTTKEGDGGLFLSIQESSARRPKEALIEKQSYTNSYSDPLHISATTKPSKVLAKKDTPEQHQVYVHIHSKQEKTAFHLDHAIQHLGEEPSQVTVDKKNCKPSVAISSARLEKELTRDEDAIVKRNVSGQDQCIDCVYAVVDKTKKKRPPTKPAPYQELVYADLSHSPKKSKNGRIHQESTPTIYADIDHVESSAMSDSNSQQENEVELTE
ncbi:uncharacterized protein LOC114955620 isoform X2 [Acropora millepora]|uniref:uncharacterized protein LOC114955620 isoform X2 n=1 Tax=Acropora millepora TaxID=45264 RepID=UPI001CF548A3|nr:uncharacterized protein LOC114955620 isoform X2 [Acropora millepora]